MNTRGGWRFELKTQIVAELTYTGQATISILE
jgi:hypothetical protein